MYPESETKNIEIPVEVPPERLSEEVLLGIIEEFILRNGTDYGWVEVSHERKVQQIKQQIDRKEIKIFFDLSAETVSLHKV